MPLPVFKDRLSHPVVINPAHVIKLTAFHGGGNYGECTLVHHSSTWQDENGEPHLFTSEVALPLDKVNAALFSSLTTGTLPNEAQ